MADDSGMWGSLGGMGAGAGIGAALALPTGGLSVPMGALIGASFGGGLGGSLFSKPKRVSVPDISAELARIRALYEEQARVAAANIKQMGAENLQALASNQASKGIYRAPVAAAGEQRVREATSRDIATSNAQIGAQSAGVQSEMLSRLLGAQQQAAQYNAEAQAQRQASIYGGLGSLGSALFSYGMQRPPAQQAGGFLPQQASLNAYSPFASNTQNLIQPWGMMQRPSFGGWQTMSPQTSLNAMNIGMGQR